jgi:flagellar capping protein FliD
VSQLAQAQTLTTKNTQADTKTAIASADSKITFTAGNGKKPVTADISAANSSLTGIRDAINKADAGAPPVLSTSAMVSIVCPSPLPKPVRTMRSASA